MRRQGVGVLAAAIFQLWALCKADQRKVHTKPDNDIASRSERDPFISTGASGNYTGDRRLSCTGISGCKKYSTDCTTCATCSSTYTPVSPTKCCKSSSICLKYDPSNCFCTECSDSSLYVINSKGKCVCPPQIGYVLDPITCVVTGCANGYTNISPSDPKKCCKDVTNCSKYDSSTCACTACYSPYLFKNGRCSTTAKPTSSPSSSPTSAPVNPPTDAPTALVCPFSCVHLDQSRRLQDLLGIMDAPATTGLVEPSSLANQSSAGDKEARILLSCPAGQFNSGGTCTQCPSNTYSAGGGALRCTNCPFGYSSLAGSTSLDYCYKTGVTSCPDGHIISAVSLRSGSLLDYIQSIFCTDGNEYRIRVGNPLAGGGLVTITGPFSGYKSGMWANTVATAGLIFVRGSTSSGPYGTDPHSITDKLCPGTQSLSGLDVSTNELDSWATLGSSAICYACPPNTYGTALSNVCTSCPNGLSSPAGSASVESCYTPTASPTVTDSPTSAAPTQQTDAPTQVPSDAPTDAPTPAVSCPEDTFLDNGSCTSCETGYNSPAGSTSIDSCSKPGVISCPPGFIISAISLRSGASIDFFKSITCNDGNTYYSRVGNSSGGGQGTATGPFTSYTSGIWDDQITGSTVGLFFTSSSGNSDTYGNAGAVDVSTKSCESGQFLSGLDVTPLHTYFYGTLVLLGSSAICSVPCPCLNGGTCAGSSTTCTCPLALYGAVCESTLDFSGTLIVNSITETNCMIAEGFWDLNHVATISGRRLQNVAQFSSGDEMSLNDFLVFDTWKSKCSASDDWCEQKWVDGKYCSTDFASWRIGFGHIVRRHVSGRTNGISGENFYDSNRLEFTLSSPQVWEFLCDTLKYYGSLDATPDPKTPSSSLKFKFMDVSGSVASGRFALGYQAASDASKREIRTFFPVSTVNSASSSFVCPSSNNVRS